MRSAGCDLDTATSVTSRLSPCNASEMRRRIACRLAAIMDIIESTIRGAFYSSAHHSRPSRRTGSRDKTKMGIAELLAFSVKTKASDLHLSAGLPPMIRVHGDVRRINVAALEHKDVHGMVYDIMNDSQRKVYEETLEVDFSFEIPNLARFRVNAFNQNRGAGAVFRTIPSKVLTLEQLNAPKIFAEIAKYPRGLVLVTGPTGSGKSTRSEEHTS